MARKGNRPKKGAKGAGTELEGLRPPPGANLDPETAAGIQRALENSGFKGITLEQVHVQQESVQQRFAPPADELAEYAKLDPSLVDRMLTTWEQQVTHVQEMQRDTLALANRARRDQLVLGSLGLFATIVIAGMFAAGTIFAIYKDALVVASILGGFDVVGLSTVLVVRSRNKKGG